MRSNFVMWIFIGLPPPESRSMPRPTASVLSSPSTTPKPNTPPIQITTPSTNRPTPVTLPSNDCYAPYVATPTPHQSAPTNPERRVQSRRPLPRAAGTDPARSQHLNTPQQPHPCLPQEHPHNRTRKANQRRPSSIFHFPSLSPQRQPPTAINHQPSTIPNRGNPTKSQ